MPEPKVETPVEELDPYSELTQVEEPVVEQTEKQEKTSKRKIQLDTEEPEKGQTSDVITEEDARRIGLSDTFIGKPYRETMEEVYKNSVKWDNKLSQQLAEMQRKQNDFEIKLSQAEIKETEKVVEETLPDYETEYQKIFDQFVDEDGFTTDKKGLAKALAKFNREYAELREKLLKKELLAELETKNAGIAQSVEESNKERFQASLYDGIEESLTEIYEDEITPEIIQKVIDDYGKFLAKEDAETQKQYTQLYAGKPAKLARDIVNYHKAIRSGKPKTEVEQAALAAHKKTIENLDKTKKTFVKSAASGRDQVEEVKKEDKDYVDLVNEALDNYDAQERFGERKG